MNQKPVIIPHPASHGQSPGPRLKPLVPPDPDRPTAPLGSPFSTLIILFFLELFVAVTLFVLPRELGMEAVRENGAVETATVIFYAAAGLMTLIALMRGARGTGLWSLLGLAALAFRELDFHFRFTALGIDKLEFYTWPETPLTHRIVAAAALVGVAVVAGALLRRTGALLRAVRRGAPCALSALAGILLLPLSLALDKTQFYLTDSLGYAADSGIAFAVLVLEEIVELFVPALFLVAAAQWIWRKDH